LAPQQAIPVPPMAVAIGIPADLLRRRADVRRAERTLAAEHARIGVAQAELYPQLTLLGNVGVQASHVSKLYEGSSTVFGIGPAVRWNLFDGARLRQQVLAQDARTEQARVAWEHTVLAAVEETENAMTAFVREQERRQALVEAATQSRRAVEFAQTQYRAGLSDFQAVLDSERALAEFEDQVAHSDATVVTHLVALYKALGGGWEDGLDWNKLSVGNDQSAD
jgi:outer membrane protein TolC